MILNNEKFKNFKEGMTVEDLIEYKNFNRNLIIVKINGELINKSKYKTKKIADKDNVQIHYQLAGG
jgi:sulfur carrier protein